MLIRMYSAMSMGPLMVAIGNKSIPRVSRWYAEGMPNDLRKCSSNSFG